ncbi:MAG TPA: arylsulfotransferase family protein [Gaiellaceae bacterium]|nr:arylsulfotransferase family protein [Gaiellaceae bacterium]
MNGSGSRRSFLGLAAAGTAALAQGRSARGAGNPPPSAPGPAPTLGPFATEPGWSPPSLVVNHAAAGVAPGYIFAAPFLFGPARAGGSGPIILDNTGQPVWYLPLSTVQGQNFAVQTYRGNQVLTWYEGKLGATYGGSCVIYDATYHELKRVHGGNGYQCDVHEFTVTDKGTALLAIANEIKADLTSVGGAADARLVEGIVQEVDIKTNKVLFEWHSYTHVPPSESFRTEVTPAGNVDYFHLNSIDVDTDGNLLVSARHTSTVYKIDRKSGRIMWRLGGKLNDFTMGAGAAFNFQHDARRRPDGTITLFDNGATEDPTEHVETYSRPLRLRINETTKTAALVRAYVPAVQRSTWAMGNVQELPDGGVFVGWGTAGGMTEFDAEGNVRFDASFADGSASYRIFRFPWQGTPRGRPSINLEQDATGALTARVSWNGATDVARWQLLSGASASDLKQLAAVPRRGFETAVTATSPASHVAVAALDAKRKQLGRTSAIALG